MKKLVLAVISFCLSGILTAQINVQWETRYNGAGGNTPEYVADMVVDAAGNIYVTGSAYTAASGYDIVTRKYDNSGAVLWTKVFNGSGNGLDQAADLEIDASGNVYVVGTSFRGGSNYDYTTIKYDAAGTQQWQMYYDAGASLYDDARSITVDASGNVIVTGAGQVSSTNTNFRTVKYNSSGTQQWAANFSSSGSNVDQGTVVLTDGSGNVYVAGNAFNSGQDLNYRVVKYDGAGTQQWTVQYNGSAVNSYDYPTDMVIDGSGNLYVTGYSYNGAGSDDDILTIKVNSSGSVVNNVTFNGTASNTDIGNQVRLDGSGNVYVVGRAKNAATAEDFFVVKYNSSLAEQWNVSINGGGNNYDEATGMAFDNSNNLYVTGYSYLSASNNDFLTAKFDPSNGTVIWTTRFNGTANNSDQARAIDVDAAGNVYVSGDSKGSGTGTDYSTIKYCQATTNAGADQQICVGDTVQLSATGGTMWTWTPAGSLTSSSISNPKAFPTSTTDYIVSSTDGNNCTDADTVTVVVNPLPGPTIIASGPTTFCVGDSVSLTATGFSAYLWNTTDTDSVITVYSQGTYTVTVTDAMNCQNSTNIGVTVNTLPNVDAGTANAYCIGDSTQLSASGASTYVWSANTFLSDTTIANPYCTATSDTTFYLTGTDANGCVNHDSVSVVVHQLPNAPTNTFVGSNYTCVTNCTGTIQWYMNGAPVAAPQGTGQVYTVTDNGDYWVTCTDVNSCTSQNSDTVTVLDWSVGEILGSNSMAIYPNPNQGNFTVQFDLMQGAVVKWDVIAVTGQVVFTETSNTGGGRVSKFFDLNDFDKGIYLIKISAGQQIITKRVIIQ